MSEKLPIQFKIETVRFNRKLYRVFFERDLSVALKKLRNAKTIRFCVRVFFSHKPCGFMSEKLKIQKHSNLKT
jgi:hypothetical protein